MKRLKSILFTIIMFSVNNVKAQTLNDSAKLINKVRPLINDGGYLVAVNNALYVSGQDYIEALNRLCADGYLQIEKLIPVSTDFIGVS